VPAAKKGNPEKTSVPASSQPHDRNVAALDLGAVEGAKGEAPQGVVLNLDEHVPYFLTYISSRLSWGSSALFLRNFGVGVTEWRVLAVIAAIPNLNANQVCGVLGLDKAAVSRALKVLARKTFVDVREDPSDTRSRRLSLTPVGTRLHDRMVATALERERVLLNPLSPDEVRVFRACLQKLKTQVSVVNQVGPTGLD
jgi:DNA-binding MarR family transcriptional regulator